MCVSILVISAADTKQQPRRICIAADPLVQACVLAFHRHMDGENAIVRQVVHLRRLPLRCIPDRTD
jgi:hypothetical protein